MIIEKVYSVQGSAIFCVPVVITSKNNTRIKHSVKKESSLSVCACFARERNTEMTSQSVPDPPSCTAIHGAKRCPTPLFKKGTTSEGKIPGQKRFPLSKQGSSESLFLRKKFWGLVGFSMIFSFSSATEETNTTQVSTKFSSNSNNFCANREFLAVSC